MTLTNTQYNAINDQILMNRKIVEDGQLALLMSGDMAAFKRARTALGLKTHPALDFERSYIPEGHGRWIAITERASEEIVGVSAVRLYENESLAHLLHARLMWGEKDHPLDAVSPISQNWSSGLYDLRGKLVLGGGAYLHPKFKGQNVGKAMAKVLHAVCLRIWEPDFFFNLMVVEKLSSKVHPEKFGYRHTDVIFEADTRPDWGPENECEIVNWKSQAEELEGYPLGLAS